jgi:hypothetical protein
MLIHVVYQLEPDPPAVLVSDTPPFEEEEEEFLEKE